VSSREHTSPDRRQKLGARSIRPAPARLEPASAVATHDQEKVLADIGHELGNFFHKLYYWADYLKSEPARAVDSTPAEMLEGTIRGLEQFLKASLDYFHPVQLSPTRMSVADLVAGLHCQVRNLSDRAPLAAPSAEEWNGACVMIDPGRLSQALAVVVRHLTKQLEPESRMTMTVERVARRGAVGVEVQLRLADPADAPRLLRTSEAVIEWAVAQRVLVLHGGELSEHVSGPSEKSVLFFLPLHSERREV
jgi:hypothetical protein